MDFQEHVPALKSWKLDPRIKQLVEHTCLYKFSDSLPQVNQRGGSFYEKVVRRFRDGAFHIGARKLHIGLADVLLITGLPIVGEPIAPNEEDCAEEVSSLLFVELDKKNLPLSLLKKKFEAVPEEVHGDGLKKYAIAYLLYIIGTVIYSSFSKLQVPACFIHLVKDLAKVNDYAWGAGVLACTMKGLSSFNPEKRISFKGNGIFLMVFLITHLPSLATFYEVDKELFPTSFPLAPDWYKLMLKHT